MATLQINAPEIIKIANTSTFAKTFVPYRENFVTTIPAGVAVELQADTAGQALYYLKQATNGLVVSQLDAFDNASDTIITLEVPAKITLTNTATIAKSFMPYRENFTKEIAVGDAVELVATTAGQVLYYLAQATDGLTVEQEALEVVGN